MNPSDRYRLAIVAPFPHEHLPLEGWMTRITSIDSQFRGIPRVYVNFSEHHDDSRCARIERDGERAEALLHPSGSRSNAFMSRLAASVDAIYVHTLHLAEYILPWLDTGNVYVDIHGITPEEEEMLGNAHLREHYETVEQAVLRQAKRCICVSEAMQEHYAQKYPSLEPHWLTIPIAPLMASDAGIDRKLATDDRRPVALYSGGTQAWQNVEAMLDLVESTGSEIDFRFLSHEQGLISQRIRERGLAHSPAVGHCDKMELAGAYRAADFGLVLRDDRPVNRVSCPTKLVEYLLFGLIPVVRSPRLGDFHQMGFTFIAEDEFTAGFIPDAASREWMAEHNLDVVRQLVGRFHAGSCELQALLSACVPRTDTANGAFHDQPELRHGDPDRHAKLPCDALEVGADRNPTVQASEADLAILDPYPTGELESMAEEEDHDPEPVVQVRDGGISRTGSANEAFQDLREFRRSVLDRHAEFPCDVLEVGTYRTPTVQASEADVRILDYYPTAELKSMAEKEGHDPESVVQVHYVCQSDNYKEVVDETYDIVIANHVLEHVDHLILWMQMVRGLIREGGLLFFVLPDKKKSFDRFRPDTPLSHLLHEHLAPETDASSIHSLETELYYDCSYTGGSNDPDAKLDVERLKNALAHCHPGVHRHVFQAETFRGRIMKPLLYTGLLDYDLLEVANCTQFGEFAVVLRAGMIGAPADPGDLFSPAADTFRYPSAG